MAKNLVSGLILANWAQILAAIPPPPPPKKNLASSVSRYPGQLSYNTISEKTNGPVLKTRSGGWTADGRE